MIEGKITRITGPIIYAEGLDGAGLYDLVDVGEKRLIGEIIRQNKGNTTVQVYEDVIGMSVGEKIISTERPLSLKLGPGLVGSIYDGIQRPLSKMAEESFAEYIGSIYKDVNIDSSSSVQSSVYSIIN